MTSEAPLWLVKEQVRRFRVRIRVRVRVRVRVRARVKGWSAASPRSECPRRFCLKGSAPGQGSCLKGHSLWHGGPLDTKFRVLGVSVLFVGIRPKSDLTRPLL